MTTATQPSVFAACSFCLKPNTEVEKLVAGPGVYICNQCVDLCVQVIAVPPEKPKPGADSPEHDASAGHGDAPQVDPWTRIDEVGKALELLPRMAAVSGQIEENLTQLVRRARVLGATWAKIGEALGMTRQSAWERFSGEE
jgi:hypothetical protein